MMRLLKDQQKTEVSNVARSTSTLVLSPPTDSSTDYQRPVSSSKKLSSSSSSTHEEPLIMKSRLDFGDEKKRNRERYEAKERESVVRKERERRVADIKARKQVMRQIEEDRNWLQSHQTHHHPFSPLDK